MKNLTYAILFALLNLLGSAKTYVIVPPALADTPPRHPLTIAQIYETAPILRNIAGCESTGDDKGTPRQFNADGTPLWGNDPITGKPVMKDVGELQIDYVHFPEAKALGLDVINSEWDNVWYGYEYLYLPKGVQPWYSSRKTCWGKDF